MLSLTFSFKNGSAGKLNKVIIDRDCPFYDPSMSGVLWLCDEHKAICEKWKIDKNLNKSFDAIVSGIDVYKKAWNKKPFVDEIIEEEGFGFGEDTV